MQPNLLIVEELMLLLLDDDGGSIRGEGTLHYTLGGAVLTELAMIGRVELDSESGGALNGPKVRPLGNQPLDDPLLQQAFDTIAAKPARVQPLILTLGAKLRPVMLERLQERGLITKETRRALGVFRTTRWPATDAEHEAELRARILAVLQDGEDPDPRTAAVIALVYASGWMPALSPRLPWNSITVKRAQAIQQGNWGAAAVNDAVLRTTAATVAASAAAAAAAASAASSATR